jgi:hypothetical protein
MANITITHPEIVKQWHPTKNGDLNPDNFTKGSKQRITNIYEPIQTVVPGPSTSGITISWIQPHDMFPSLETYGMYALATIVTLHPVTI